MEIKTYLEILWQRKWVIAITAMTTVVLVVVGTLLMAPSYEAHATVRVAIASSSSISYTDYMYAERLMNTYTELATSGPVLEELERRLDDREPARIEVKVIPNTELITIVVEDTSPVLASAAANTLAEILVAQSRELYASGAKTAQEILGEQLALIEEELKQARREYDDLIPQVPINSARLDALKRSIELKQETYNTLLQQYETARATEAIRANALSIVEGAVPPQEPSKPRKVLNVVLGCMVGIVGGVGLAFLIEHLDTRLYSVAQIERVTGLRTLGRIPHVRGKSGNALWDDNSPQWEAYRHLQTNIYAAAQGGMLQTLLITSAEPREGKSTTVTNLAAAMARAGQRVLAVDGDLRRPTLHTKFGLPNGIGLTSILLGELELQEAVQDIEITGVSVLTSGRLLPSPAQLLGAYKMKALLEEMCKHFDLILIDTPALVPVADAAMMAPLVDGVLLVVGRAQAESEAVRSTIKELTDIGAKIVGLVVNRVKRGRGYRYYDYYRLPESVLNADPLTRIDGIGPVYEKALNALGIVNFAQLSEQEPVALAERMNVRIAAERISQDRWVEQAQALCQDRDDGNPRGGLKGQSGRWQWRKLGRGG